MEAQGESSATSGNQIVVSIIAFGAVVLIGLLLAWLLF